MSTMDDLIADLVAANHILYDQQVLDGFGHVSVRDPGNPEHFLLARALAPGLVTAADIAPYGLDGQPLQKPDHAIYIERFIHSEVYRARPDVNAVVHSHSPTVVPFGVTTTPMRPVSVTAAFLGGEGVPVFEMRDIEPKSDLLISTAARGQAMAKTLGKRAMALLRGHGNVVAGNSVRGVVSHAIYTEINARLQLQALTIGGPVTYLSADETAAIAAMHEGRGNEGLARTWAMWKKRAEENRR